jgi:hypothetical protein
VYFVSLWFVRLFSKAKLCSLLTKKGKKREKKTKAKPNKEKKMQTKAKNGTSDHGTTHH